MKSLLIHLNELIVLKDPRIYILNKLNGFDYLCETHPTQYYIYLVYSEYMESSASHRCKFLNMFCFLSLRSINDRCYYRLFDKIKKKELHRSFSSYFGCSPHQKNRTVLDTIVYEITFWNCLFWLPYRRVWSHLHWTALNIARPRQQISVVVVTRCVMWMILNYRYLQY